MAKRKAEDFGAGPDAKVSKTDPLSRRNEKTYFSSVENANKIDWCSLPQHIIERIADAAVKKEAWPEDPDDFECHWLVQNDWLMAVRKMALVCSRWRDIIYSYKPFFLDTTSSEWKEDLSMHWSNWSDATIQFDTSECGLNKNEVVDTATLLVKEGFLRYAKVLFISDTAPEDVIFLVRDHAQDSAVTKFKIEIDPSWSWTAEHWNALINVLRQSKPKSIYINYTIKKQADAVTFWSFFMSLCHVCGESLDWLWFELDEPDFAQIDWTFTYNFVYTFKIVSIKKFHMDFIADPYPNAIRPFDSFFEYDCLTENNACDFVAEIHTFLDEYNRQSKNIKDNHEYIHQRLIEHSARHAEVLEEDYMGRLNPEDRDENYVEGINELRRIVRYGRWILPSMES